MFKVIEDWINNTLKDRSGYSPTMESITAVWSAVVFMYPMGGVLGSALTVLSINCLGIRLSLMMSKIFMAAGILCMALSKFTKSFEVLMLGRFLSGTCCGLESALSPMYLTEISTIRLRGSVGSMYHLFLTIGILFGQLSGVVAGTKNLYPYHLTLLPAFIAIVQVVMIHFCPESPKHLAVKGHEEEAHRTLTWFRGEAGAIREWGAVKREIEAAKLQADVKFGEYFMSRSLRTPLTISIIMMMAHQFSCIYLMLFYSTHVFRENKMPSKAAIYATSGMNVINILTTVIFILGVDLLGRRILLLTSVVMLSILMACCVFLYDFNVDVVKKIPNLLVPNENGKICCVITFWFHKASRYLTVLVLYSYVFSFAIGIGPVPSFLVMELFSKTLRPVAVAIATSVNWMTFTLVSVIFMHVEAKVNTSVMAIFAFLMSFTACYLLPNMPETTNMPIEKITAYFKELPPALPPPQLPPPPPPTPPSLPPPEE